MPTYTVLKRDDLVRAEQDSDAIQQWTLCGYEKMGQFDAQDADQAIAQFRAGYHETKPSKPLGLRWMIWVFGSFAIVWFLFVLFYMLPSAFQD
ncbi:hypothetical protein MAQ5080_01459 [Marinomonas aquimarina]|uniref:Uncharacterized protein n=1 Tax=Marinomonas aquimarina TaxID=295068 RepID=A0A1A8TA05_9GAMM|nr:hypothetical protein [Marinomonas aquimarina]SBS29643.1 hypothetical protein MAQ5080_01459 [Marinomonas aquimarina]